MKDGWDLMEYGYLHAYTSYWHVLTVPMYVYASIHRLVPSKSRGVLHCSSSGNKNNPMDVHMYVCIYVSIYVLYVCMYVCSSCMNLIHHSTLKLPGWYFPHRTLTVRLHLDEEGPTYCLRNHMPHSLSRASVLPRRCKQRWDRALQCGCSKGDEEWAGFNWVNRGSLKGGSPSR
jgi:hypothetical protein